MRGSSARGKSGASAKAQRQAAAIGAGANARSDTRWGDATLGSARLPAAAKNSADSRSIWQMAKAENVFSSYEVIETVFADGFEERARRPLPRELPVLQLQN